MQKRYEGRPIRVVLDGGDFRWDARLIALEINDAVLALGPAAATAHRDVAVVVAAGDALFRREQRLVRAISGYLLAREVCLISSGRRRRCELFNSHPLLHFGF